LPTFFILDGLFEAALAVAAVDEAVGEAGDGAGVFALAEGFVLDVAAVVLELMDGLVLDVAAVVLELMDELMLDVAEVVVELADGDENLP